MKHKYKLLSVEVNGKEVYYVVRKMCTMLNDDFVNAYGVYDAYDELVVLYTLKENAYIHAIEKALEKGKGSAVVKYHKETSYFKDYQLTKIE